MNRDAVLELWKKENPEALRRRLATGTWTPNSTGSIIVEQPKGAVRVVNMEL